MKDNMMNRIIQFFSIARRFIGGLLIALLFVLSNAAVCITLVRATQADWKSYVNQPYRFQIKYPADWRVRESPLPIYPDTFSVQVFFDSSSQQKEVSIRVYPKDDEGMIRAALNIISEIRVVVGGVEGVRITGVGHKEGFPPVIITFVRKGPYLYVFEGEGDIFNKMLSTFTFIR